MKLHRLLQAAGMAALVLFPCYPDIFSRLSGLRMHTSSPIRPALLSLILNLALATLVFFLMEHWIARSGSWNRGLRGLFPAFVVASIAEMIYLNHTARTSARVWILTFTFVVLVGILLRWRWKHAADWPLQLAGIALLSLGFFSLMVVVQLAHMAMWTPLPNHIEHAAQAPGVDSHPKVVWILFDEASYQQIFGSRYPGLRLPNFDKLRQSATLFTDTRPVADRTEKAVPSILLGQRIEDVNYNADNQLQVKPQNGSWIRFDPLQTPFATAHLEGLTTGVAGWYNPYCSILASNLDQCYWTGMVPLPESYSGEGFWQNLAEPWRRYAKFLLHKHSKNSILIQIETYQDLMKHSKPLLLASGPDLVFLHLPLPHPPGFYNRRAGRFDTSGNRSYIDNLSLADKTLGELTAMLQQSPRWKKTSIVICGDHSWRTYLWRKQAWTAEDNAASHGGVFDPRPLLLVHVAGQAAPATVHQPFSMLGVHAILNDLVQGKQPAFAGH